MLKINAPPALPPEVLLEREKNNRAAAFAGWGPALRLKFVRTRVAPRVAVTLGSGGFLAVLAVFNLVR